MAKEKRKRLSKEERARNAQEQKKRICFRTAAPFEELESALKILNEPRSSQPKVTSEYCKFRKHKLRKTVIVEKTSSHLRDLIKNAIFKHKWKTVCELILDFIRESRQATNREGNRTYLLNTTLAYLLNDDVAKEHNLLRDYFQLLIECDSDEKRQKILKKIITSI